MYLKNFFLLFFKIEHQKKTPKQEQVIYANYYYNFKFVKLNYI